MTKISAKALLVFFEGLHHLLGAGLDLITALEIQSQQHSQHAHALKAILTALRSGQPFSQALSQTFQIPNMIRMTLVQSEHHGDCSLACQHAATWLRDQLAWKGMILRLSFYPLLLIITSIGLFVVMLTLVLPEFAALYDTLEVDLPASTGWLIKLRFNPEDILRVSMFFFIPCIILIRLSQRSDTLRFFVEKSLSKVVGVKQLMQVHHEYQFALQLGTLLQSGSSLSQAIEIMRMGTDSLIFKQYLLLTEQSIARGNSLSQSLCHGLMQRQTFSALVSLAEQTGRLDVMMLNLAEHHKQKSLIWQDQAKQVIQPLITLFLGGFLAFWILLLYYPMLQLGTNLG
jgi:type II secretory pathway component PulF